MNVAAGVTFELEVSTFTKITAERHEPATYPIGVGDGLPDVCYLGRIVALQRDRDDLAALGLLLGDLSCDSADFLGDVDDHFGSSWDWADSRRARLPRASSVPERIEPGAPVLTELIKPVINLPQRSRIDGVKSARSFGAYGGKTGLPEHSQVLRHRRLSYAELCRDRCHHRTGRMLARGQELEDPTPDGITEDIQRVHATHSINQSLI